jgi:hypothetical protein
VLKLRESVPHHGSAVAVVFATAATTKQDAVAMQTAHTENLGTIRLPLPVAAFSTLVREL